ncbi:MAG TPA: hypothetical protein VF412_09655 [Bdellovibrio sp.]|uniref:hypothetical protein n=1 Tax=Bdellovibrio sp. TaxID=28201 RepID=UPI002EF3C3B6
MKLSQFGTKILAAAAVTVLSLNGFAQTSGRLNLSQGDNDFKARVNQLLADKKRSNPDSLTPELSIYSAKAPIKTPSKINALKMGGVSDGGGNAVGATLFDFYENQGSLPVTVDELLTLEPKAKQVIALLNQQIPAVGSIDSGAFGEMIKGAIKGKKIYLESKPISSEACRNQSMVSTDQQVIAACQSDTELRIDVNWMAGTNGNNRAGLIAHEFILAWARDHHGNLEKPLLEEKVRDLNRAVFTPHADENELPQTLNKVFGDEAFSASNFKVAGSLPARIKNATAAFCQNPMTDISSQFQDVWNNGFLNSNSSVVPARLLEMKDASEKNRASAKQMTVQEGQAGLCSDYNLDHTPVHDPDLTKLSDTCQSQMQDISTNLTNLLKRGRQAQLTKIESDFLVGGWVNAMYGAASMCSGLRGIQLEKKLFMSEDRATQDMADVYIESINYFRYLMQQKGINFSFVDQK